MVKVNQGFGFGSEGGLAVRGGVVGAAATTVMDKGEVPFPPFPADNLNK